MATSTTVIGVMTKHMGSGSIRTQMVRNTRGTGLTINSMERAKKSGRTVLNMKAITRAVKKTVTASSSGPTNQATPANSTKTTSTASASTAGPTVAFTMANGPKIKCRGAAFLLGLMAGVMKVSITTIKKKVVAALSGLMGEVMMVTGAPETKRAWAFIITQRVKFVTAAGKMVRERNGYRRESFIKKPKDTSKVKDEYKFLIQLFKS